MAHLTIIVPDEHVDALRRELLRAHAERAAALRRALEHYVKTRERLDDVEGALVELADLHAAIAQLGWAARAETSDVVVTAHPEVLADAAESAAAAAGTAGTAVAAGLRELASRVGAGVRR